MRTIRITLALVLGVFLASGHASSDDKKKPSDPPTKSDTKDKGKVDPKTAQAKLMASKLRNAQLLLDGLATNDFAKITKSADELLLISKTAEFSALKTKEYEVHTNNFRRSLEEIVKKAKDKNLDGATLGYVDMTLTCVRCHQHTREARDAKLPLPNVPGIRTAIGGE